MITLNKYKKLYETEVNNRKLYEKRYKEIKKENVELQKEKGLPELKKKLMELSDRVDFLKEDRAKLYIQLEDTRNELEKLKKENNNGEGN